MTISFHDLSQKFLAWSAKNQAPRCTEMYEGIARRFMVHLGENADKPCNELKPFHVNEYIDAHDKWSNNYKQSTVTCICRIFNWGVSSGYIEENPVKSAFRATKEGRKTWATLDDYKSFLGALTNDDPLRDFLIVLWECYARPQEVRHIEARHVDLVNRQINFPAKESKGKRHPRCILILNEAFPIIERLVAKYPSGKLFRDSHGEPWSKFAICARFRSLSEKIGIKRTAYDFRHGIITLALEEDKNLMDVAAAAGHVDGSMVGKIYSHVHENKKRLIGVFERPAN